MSADPERHLYTAPNGHQYWCYCDTPPTPLASETTDPPVRSMLDGSPCWCYAPGIEPHEGWVHGSMCVERRAASETTDAGLRARAEACRRMPSQDAYETLVNDLLAALSSSGSIDAERLARALVAYDGPFDLTLPIHPSKAVILEHVIERVARELARLSESHANP